MGLKSIRLASMLSFDENQEDDIIKMVEYFNGTHRMGGFLSNLLRIAIENPEMVVAKEGKYEVGDVIKVMEGLGKSPTRHSYMAEVNKKLADMQVKVDKIYDMCFKMYTMAEIGKQLGFEKKTENMVLAEFMVEQQLEKLQSDLGVKCANVPFAANRLADYKERAAGTLEYIISCYEPVINELKKELNVTVKELEIPVKTLEIPVVGVSAGVNIGAGTGVNEVQQQVPTQTVEAKKEALTFENISKLTDEDDTEVDLGNTLESEKPEENIEFDMDNLGMLSDFFNDGM